MAMGYNWQDKMDKSAKRVRGWGPPGMAFGLCCGAALNACAGWSSVFCVRLLAPWRLPTFLCACLCACPQPPSRCTLHGH